MQENLFGEPEAPAMTKRQITRAQKAARVPVAEVNKAFEYWRDMFWAGRGPRPKLSEARSRLIAAAIYDYGLESVKLAIKGCSLSDFYMGNNRAGRRYNDIELILRDAEHIEKFIALTVEDESRGEGNF